MEMGELLAFHVSSTGNGRTIGHSCEYTGKWENYWPFM